jgi:hypothetical protein
MYKRRCFSFSEGFLTLALALHTAARFMPFVSPGWCQRVYEATLAKLLQKSDVAVAIRYAVV